MATYFRKNNPKLTIDGQEWIKEYDSDTKPIAFILEAKYDYEVEGGFHTLNNVKSENIKLIKEFIL